MRLSRRRWWVALLAEVALGAGVKGIHFATAAGGRACGRARVRRRRPPAVRAVRVQLGSWIHSASVMEIGSWPSTTCGGRCAGPRPRGERYRAAADVAQRGIDLLGGPVAEDEGEALTEVAAEDLQLVTYEALVAHREVGLQARRPASACSGRSHR